MKQKVGFATTLMVTLGIAAVPAAAQTDAGAVTESSVASDITLAPEELQTLVAPIALYPDVLIAQLLPAATFPTDIVLAARWLRTNPDMKDVADKPWDVTVKALCNYPDVLYLLDEDLEWTNALGAAFLAQPEDVMTAIQAGRELAQERDLLETTPQQTVVVDDETIRIVPTETNTIYVPQYDPEIIYIDDDDDDYDDVWVGATVGFGTGLALGAWLNMDCDWHGHVVHYCQPGYWGGWAHHGAVTWGDDWVAGVGPRGGFIAGEDRGVAVGRRGGAAWGPNGGAVWRRPPVATPRPAYTGRYAAYGRSAAAYRGSRSASATINRNVNNVNIDRGDRTAIGGDRTNIGGTQRPAARPGQGTARVGNRPAQPPARPRNGAVGQRSAAPSQRGTAAPTAGAARRPQQTSAFNERQRPAEVNNYRNRGQQSREAARPSRGSSAQRSTPAPPRAQPSRSSRPSRQSAFNSGGGRQSSSHGSRGSSSRGGGGRAGGGGGRRR